MVVMTREFRHLMWYTFAGTSGGMTRIKIVGLVRKEPMSVNKLCEKLGSECEDALHHIKILSDNMMIVFGKSKNEGKITTSEMFDEESETFRDILQKLGIEQEKEVEWKDFDDRWGETPTIWSDNV